VTNNQIFYAELSHSAACTCGHSLSRVVESRKSNMGKSVRRRRECESCGARWTTYELHEGAIYSLMVGVEHIDPSCLSPRQASRILRALADRIDEEVLPQPVAKAEKAPAITEVGPRLSPMLSPEPVPKNLHGDDLETFDVVADEALGTLSGSAVGRSQAGEWYLRSTLDGESFWCKIAGGGYCRALEAAYVLQNLEEAEVD
jgi:hypothetical protein